jgi:uncharacterized protein YkwD
MPLLTHRPVPLPRAFAAVALVLVAAVPALLPQDARAASRAVRLSPVEHATLDRINAYRRAHHRAPLRIDRRLTRSARWMARDLQTHPYFAHTDSTGRSPFARIAAYGYPSRTTTRGENLNAGFDTVAASFAAWRASPEHNANMLSAKYHTIGVSVRFGNAGGAFSSYWVTDFG